MRRITIRVLEDRTRTTPSDQGFLKVRRLLLRNHYDDGTESAPYAYDVVDRTALDAVAMVLHADNPDNPRDPLVLMRTALRPPVGLRVGRDLPLPDTREHAQIWELPAGIIELGEHGVDGILRCAARETHEETGYHLDVTAFQMLGPPVFLTPGLCAEKVYFAQARIPDRDAVGHAALDGSPVEESATVEFWPLSVCLQRTRTGELEDAKTEVGLHRLAATLARA
ncbi:MAG: NUDIX domain-containing protein [Myxococcota bacterium]